MRFSDINKKYTEIVNKYIAEGYIINSATMSGHQGEISKIDLVKDNELIRVWLNSESSGNWMDDGAWQGEIIALRVSVWNKSHEHLHYTDTVWMQDLTHIAEYNFYSLTRYGTGRNLRYYTDSIDEALFSQKVRRTRLRNRPLKDSVIDITSDKTKEIAGKWLKRTKGYQRISWDKITVYKRTDKHAYTIRYNGTNYTIA